jgi:hypothetical protein
MSILCGRRRCSGLLRQLIFYSEQEITADYIHSLVCKEYSNVSRDANKFPEFWVCRNIVEARRNRMWKLSDGLISQIHSNWIFNTHETTYSILRKVSSSLSRLWVPNLTFLSFTLLSLSSIGTASLHRRNSAYASNARRRQAEHFRPAWKERIQDIYNGISAAFPKCHLGEGRKGLGTNNRDLRFDREHRCVGHGHPADSFQNYAIQANAVARVAYLNGRAAGGNGAHRILRQRDLTGTQ